MGERVVVAMSGGVDSSVAALLEKNAGSEVIGITMQMYDQGLDRDTGARHGCCTIDDTLDARRVAEVLDIPHYVLNHEVEFEQNVVRPYVEDYLSGRTPSPCVRCNTYVKFDALLMRARALGATKLITGHYARITQTADGKSVLRKGLDEGKDQSYFLFGVSARALDSVRFPVGQYTKAEIRELAVEAGLPVAHKPESMETCFIGDEGHAQFVEKTAAQFGLPDPKPGQFVGAMGQEIGTHGGVHNFTIGQRKGLGIATGERIFVHSIDPKTGQVEIGPRGALLAKGLVADTPNWFGLPPAPGREIMARIRHRHGGARARIKKLDDAGFELEFLEPVHSVAPGQAVVLYEGDAVLGGGWIVRSCGAPASTEPRVQPDVTL